MKESILSLCRTGLLCAVALVLSVVENTIPTMPFMLPGMKLGLSNIAVMFSLEVCSLPCALSVVAVKAIFALATRGAVAFMMSFFGGICATLVMFLLVRSNRLRFGYLGIGVAGAFMHNTGQLLAALLLISKAVFAYLPVLCVSALVTGALTGLVCYFLIPPIKRLPLMENPYIN